MCSAFLSAYNPSPVLDTAIPMLRVHQPSWTVMNESPTMECWSKFDGIKKLLLVHRSHSFTHKTLDRLDHPLNDGKHSSDNRRRNRKARESEGVHSRAPPGKLAAGVKRWRCRRVSHSHTQHRLSHSICPPSVPTSTRFRVSGCQSAGWLTMRRQVSVVGWCPLLLISGLPVSVQLGLATLPAAACASFRLPTPSQPQPGGVWKAQQ